MRPQRFEVENDSPLAKQRTSRAAHQDIDVAPDIDISRVVLKSPNREISSRRDALGTLFEDAEIRDQPPRARARVLRPSGPAEKLTNARGEIAAIIGDQEQCVR